MKNLFSMLLVFAMLFGCAFAQTAYVTISNGQGELVMANAPVEVSDTDEDGAVTISDALFAAHEAAFEGGAAAGYEAADAGYGLSISKLWGEANGTSYGYYLNDAYVLSLGQPIADGDSVQAFVFTDLEAWSDTYSYFSLRFADAAAGEAFEITLCALVYDADWNLNSVPVSGAVITIDGADSEFVTDAEGRVSVVIDAAGEYLLSAHSDEMNLVPPACTAKIV